MLGYSQIMLTDAAKMADRKEACRMMRSAGELVPMARAAIEAGKDAFAEAADQSLRAVGELEAYVGKAVPACGPESP